MKAKTGIRVPKPSYKEKTPLIATRLATKEEERRRVVAG